MYWFDFEEWYTYELETDRYKIKPDAPKRIRDSFEMWKEKNPNHAA
jgi:hypothetical protein